MGQGTPKGKIEELNEVTLKGVVPLNEKLGRGSYGGVFTVKHNGNVFAAKRIHSVLIDEDVTPQDRQAIKNDFIKECLCCSSIRHPHIVQFVGVYFDPSSNSSLPIMVMELMQTSLRIFIEGNKTKITFGRKASILYEVSLGLSFLHNHEPPILHRDLSPNNVMLTSQLVAKIGDLGVAKVVRADSWQTRNKLRVSRAVPGTQDFMPPEVMEVDSLYGTSIDVFSFGGIALYVFSEEWPTPRAHKQKDPNNNKMVTLTEAERRQQYLNRMINEAAELRKVVEQCLDDDPDARPSIEEVSKIMEPLRESPPFAEVLQSTQYHIKWTSGSDLPHKLYGASVAVSAAGDTVYVTAGSAPDDKIYNNVYCYKANTDHWTEMPQPGHRFGVLHMLNDRLTIFGGQDPFTHKYHDKVTTYNNDTNNWESQYPAMLNERFRPGVITYHNYVIVMGGKSSPDADHDSIEIMEYHDQLQWKEISIRLPVPMWGITPTFCGENITIVGYSNAGGRSSGHHQITTDEIISSFGQPPSTATASTKWKMLLHAKHFNTATIPNSNPLLVIGGNSHDNQGSVRTADVTLYDVSTKLWRKVDSLTTARSDIGVALLNNHTIIVIGGTTCGAGVEETMASSLTKVEIGKILYK